MTEAPPDVEREFWTGTRLLLGLRFKRGQTNQLLKGIFKMLDLRESDTYQEILEEGEAIGLAKGKVEGKAEGKREVLLRAGTRRFGVPDDATRSVLTAISTEGELDRLVDRLFEVESWHDLLIAP